MFNFSKKIFLSIGVLLIIFVISIVIFGKYAINSVLEENLYRNIPVFLKEFNKTSFSENEINNLKKNVKSFFNNYQSDLNIAYISVHDKNNKLLYFRFDKKFNELELKNALERSNNPKNKTVLNVFKIKDDYIKEVLISIGDPDLVGFVKIGYYWEKIKNKGNIIIYGILGLTIVLVLFFVILTILLNSSFNREISEYIFQEKKIISETIKQHTLKEVELKNIELSKKNYSTELFQNDFFKILEMIKELLKHQSLDERNNKICDWIQKIFDAKKVLFYNKMNGQNYVYAVCGKEGRDYLKDLKENNVIIGEGILGTSLEHKKVIIGDERFFGDSLLIPLIDENTNNIIGGLSINIKNNDKKFDEHDKLIGRVIFPIISRIIKL